MSRRTRHIPEAAQEAVEKYREFHRLDPRKIGAFPQSFTIPERMYRAGKGVWVTYRSGKVDPETLRKPKSPVNYIHEFEAGVQIYVPKALEYQREGVDVPSDFTNIAALTRLGLCLGFCIKDSDGHEVEARGTRPLPDLYSHATGRCLYVIQSRRTVLAMIWGGALGVFARGIDG